jgi:peptide deformylase
VAHARLTAFLPRGPYIAAVTQTEGARLVRLMTALEIVQKGDPLLARRDLAPFDLPAERVQVARVVDRLWHIAATVDRRYPFKVGMGLAAPQIGIARRAAIVRYGIEPIVLVNPRVIERGPDEVTKHFEGCLSFFDVRGRVARPQWIVVEHQLPLRKTRFEGAAARLVAHELDHLDGVLYDERMEPADRLVPVHEYRLLAAC